MKNLKQYIRLVDVFSVKFAPSINEKTKKNHYQSVLGGIVSIIIYAFILIYGLRLLQQWITNQMPFKISTYEKAYVDKSFTNYFQSNNFTFLIDINMNWVSDEDYNFFDQNNLIFIPLLVKAVEEEPPINLLKFYDDSTKLIHTELGKFDYFEYLFLLLPCLTNQQYLDNNQKCADQGNFSNLISIAGLEIVYNFKIDKFNIYTNANESAQFYISSFIQDMFSTSQDINFKLSHYNVIKGFFSESNSDYMYVSDFRSQNQMSTREYFTLFYQQYVPNIQNVYSAAYIYSDITINEVLIQYPTIAEVFASIGSIMQVLLIIGILIRYINEKWMIQEFKLQYMDLFFPQLQKITKQNVDNVEHYLLENKTLNTKSYKCFLKTISEKIEEKLNYQNLIYEISRIQIVLEDITTQYKILSSHFRHFELDIFENKMLHEYFIYNQWNKEKMLQFSPRISLAPFALNQSMQKQSEQFCRDISSDQELLSPQSIKKRKKSIHLQT